MNFVLFLILNVLLLIRPEELVPGLAGARLYLITILACVATTLPGIVARLTPDALRDRPIGVCVLGLWAAGFLSLLFYRFRIEAGLDFLGEFGKVILYYFLLVAVVDTPARFRAFVGWLVLCVGVSSGLATLDFLDVIDIPAINHVYQHNDYSSAGDRTGMIRLCSSGIFSDPNDLALALSFAILASVYLAASGTGALRLAWLLPVGPLLYAMSLTASRGGFLGFVVGIGAWLFARYRGKKAVPLAAAAVVGLIAVAGGRMGSIGGGGTAHERIMLWAYGIGDLFRMPVYLPVGLGVGYYVEEYGFLAHNSFVNAYVETGLLGGGLFAVAFYTAGRLTEGLTRLPAVSDWGLAARPFIFAAVVSYAAGAFSVSRQYALPTYILLGLVSAYWELALPAVPDRCRVDTRWWVRAAGLSVGGLLALKVVTQGLGVFGL